MTPGVRISPLTGNGDPLASWPEELRKNWVTIWEQGSREDRWLSTEEAAANAGFKAVTVARACRRGEIPTAEKVGGKWRIPEKAVSEWIKVRSRIEMPKRVEPCVGRTSVVAERGTLFRERVMEAKG